MLYRILAILFASFFISGSSPIYSPPIAIDVFKNKAPKRVLAWEMTPSVVICDYAPIDKQKVVDAIGWWKNLGYSFYGPYTDDYHKQKCFKNRPIGYILIMLVDGGSYNHSSLATTNIYSDKDSNEILWSVIMLKYGLVKERVMEHEFGHSIGWMHTSKRGNMMNRTLEHGGWDSEGLANPNRSN